MIWTALIILAGLLALGVFTGQALRGRPVDAMVDTGVTDEGEMQVLLCIGGRFVRMTPDMADKLAFQLAEHARNARWES